MTPAAARWCCVRCGHCWPGGNPPPGAFDRCECPYPRRVDLLLTWDDEPKAEDTNRLERMAAQAVLITEARNIERLDAELNECRAELDRLRTIVDLACAVHRGSRFDWEDDKRALFEAVAAEVARRRE